MKYERQIEDQQRGRWEGGEAFRKGGGKKVGEHTPQTALIGKDKDFMPHKGGEGHPQYLKGGKCGKKSGTGVVPYANAIGTGDWANHEGHLSSSRGRKRNGRKEGGNKISRKTGPI